MIVSTVTVTMMPVRKTAPTVAPAIHPPPQPNSICETDINIKISITTYIYIYVLMYLVRLPPLSVTKITCELSKNTYEGFTHEGKVYLERVLFCQVLLVKSYFCQVLFVLILFNWE